MSRQFRVPLACLTLLSAAVSSAALLPGCKSAEEKIGQKAVESAVERAIEEKTGKEVTVETSQQGVVIASKDGKDSVRLDTSSGKPPEDWPSEVPIYPGAKIGMSMKLGRGYTLTLETPDELTKVTEFYKTQLASLPQRSSIDLGKNQTLLWSDEKKPLSVTLAANGGQGGQPTRATLIVSRDREKSASR